MAPHESAALYDHDLEIVDDISDTGEAHNVVPLSSPSQPGRTEAEAAVKTLISYTGENADRAGVLETPKRVVKAFDEWFGGYKIDADGLLSKTFDEVEGYQDMVLLRDIPFHSHCEHHMAPIVGKAHVAYMPKGRVVGISKLARVVDAFARRFQIQERMTEEVAKTIERVLEPLGVAVVIEAEHHCMTTRGIHTHDTVMHTKHLSGVFREDSNLRREFFDALR
ncbi:MAG: GTP cyclohydrolase I FolE [Alphaproteobacteria bacterium]|jgi:GTP cyclohydrolase I